MTSKQAFIKAQLKKGRSQKQAENAWNLTQINKKNKSSESSGFSIDFEIGDMRGEVGRLEDLIESQGGEWVKVRNSYLKNRRK